MKVEEFIIESAKTALVDSSVYSEKEYRPQMVYNDGNGHSVLNVLSKEMEKCESFSIAVAFIKSSGIASLLEEFNGLRHRGIKGRILTTDYLTFNEPSALRWLKRYENLEVKVFLGDLHAKGYIFNREDSSTIIVGSSNLTDSALKSNMEWNVRFTSTDQGDIVSVITAEFNRMWNSKDAVDLTEEWLSGYELIYKEKQSKKDHSIIKNKEIRPTKHQEEALEKIRELRLRENIPRGKNRALLISATGTGKTYISAFDVKDANPKKLLFMVHRSKILEDAKKSYQNIFGNNRTFGIYKGSRKERNVDFLFASVDSLKLHYKEFDPEEFDYMVCDEAHHIVADGQRKIIEYFKPKFILGMTATPERRLDRPEENVYSVFNYDVPYEIRLSRALEEKLVCPFHYYGIAYLGVDNKRYDLKDFSKLEVEERVKQIVDAIENHPFSGDRIRGLIFCNTNDEGAILEKYLSQYYLVKALKSKDPDNVRNEYFKKLESNERQLDFIITVDILNEGIDLPRVNEIVMLRRTESPIIFIQQLGRGLRKREDKDYLTVLDFIGNYNNNYIIPMALFGDNTRNRENLGRKTVMGNNSIRGASTVYFDYQSKERILSKINSARIFNKSELEAEYQNAIERLGREPNFVELYDIKGLDPRVIVRVFGSLNEFRKLIGSKSYCGLNNDESLMIKQISKCVVNGFRPHECMIIKELVKYGSASIDTLVSLLGKDDPRVNREKIVAVAEMLTKSRGFFDKDLCVLDESKIIMSREFDSMMKNDVFKEMVLDVVICGEHIFREEYSEEVSDEYDFRLHKLYSHVDYCRIMNLNKGRSSNIFGYRVIDGCCPLFASLKKGVKDNKYGDTFIDNRTFHWQSRELKNDEGKEIKAIRNSNSNGLKILLFVKKQNGNKEEDYYYCGRVRLVEGSYGPAITTNSSGREIEVREMDFRLDYAVPEDLLNDYFNNWEGDVEAVKRA